MNRILLFLLLAPTMGMSQVNFEQDMSWAAILAKAKAEHKYVFVDCFATWCGPCKKMDRDVYPADSIGAEMNKDFISVKVQMDTTKADGEAVRGWYADAHRLMVENKVGAFPTYLFYSPEGELVHRGLGFQKVADFLVLARNAMDRSKQYYPLLAKYEAGVRDYSVMPYLAYTAKKIGEEERSAAIARDYFDHYLNKLSCEEAAKKDNVLFEAEFAEVLTSKDKVFKCILEHGELADSGMHDPAIATRFVVFMSYQEVVVPAEGAAKRNKTEPDWDGIMRQIRKRFGEAYSQKDLISEEVGFYRKEKNWPKYAQCLVRQMEVVGHGNLKDNPWSSWGVNNDAYDVFLYSSSKEELEKALGWMNEMIASGHILDGEEMDTKASLLYKLGQKEEALDLEAKAVAAAPKDTALGETYQKMQRGKATWNLPKQ